MTGDEGTIGAITSLCLAWPTAPRDGDRVSFEVLRADGTRELSAFVYQPTIIQEGVASNLDAFAPVSVNTVSGLATIFYLGDVSGNEYGPEGPPAGHSFAYQHRPGDPAGTYTIVLRVNEAEVARTEITVSRCDCPKVEGSLQAQHPMSFSPAPSLATNPTVLALEYSGYRPGEKVDVMLLAVEGPTSHETTSNKVRYAWTITMNDLGEAYEEVVLDGEMASPNETSYFWLIAGRAKRLINIDLEDGKITLGTSPVQIQAPTQEATAGEVPTEGLHVMAVDPGSAAEQAGFRAGQILVILNNHQVRTVAEVRAELTQNSDRVVEAQVWTGEGFVTLTVTPTGGPIGVDLCELARCQ